MIGPLIPFHIARQHLAGVATGNLVRYGAILKDAGTGRIVGHLQETGLLSKALEQGMNVANPFGLAADGISVIQNEQIKGKLDAIQSTLGALQGLQIANLGVSLIGVGVTVASTVMILRRMDGLQNALNDLAQEIPRQFQELLLKDLLVEIRTDLQRWAEREAWKNGEQVEQGLDRRLDLAFERCYEGVLRLLEESSVNTPLLRNLLIGMELTAGTQTQLLLRLDERAAAQGRTQRNWQRVEQLAWDMPPDRLQTLLSDDQQATLLANTLQQLRVGLAGQSALLGTLCAADVSGPQYLVQAEQEQEEPLLFLPAADGEG